MMTPAQHQALAQANAELNNAGLPTVDELIAVLRNLHDEASNAVDADEERSTPTDLGQACVQADDTRSCFP